jgi:ABC-type Na+ efflux pump permease subunit
MINQMQMAIIKKDLRTITANSRMLTVLIVVPLVMIIILPSVFVFITIFSPVDSPDFIELVDLLGSAHIVDVMTGHLRHTLINLMMNNVIPLFFMMIPIMASSAMAANAFVGEKEKHTLETLLYCPLPLKEIFIAKILASFLLSMAVSVFSFIAMTVVVELEVSIATGAIFLPGITWLIMLLLVSPSVSLISISMIVRGSAKSQSSEESQQRSVFLILPIILLIFGQFAGIMLISPLLFLAIGFLFALTALLVLKGSFSKFQYETLLR